jgi:hypothetical protein
MPAANRVMIAALPFLTGRNYMVTIMAMRANAVVAVAQG